MPLDAKDSSEYRTNTPDKIVKSNMFQRPPPTPPFQSSGPLLVNGHPSIKGTHSNSSSRQHSPISLQTTQHQPHQEQSRSNMNESGLSPSSGANNIIGNYQRNLYDNSQLQKDSKTINNRLPTSKPPENSLNSTFGLSNTQSTPNLESFTFNNPNNLNSNSPNPASNNLSRSYNNLTNGVSFSPTCSDPSLEVTKGKDLINKFSSNGSFNLPPASLSSLDKTHIDPVSPRPQTIPVNPSTKSTNLLPVQTSASLKCFQTSPSSSPQLTTTINSSHGQFKLPNPLRPTPSPTFPNGTNHQPLGPLPSKLSEMSIMQQTSSSSVDGTMSTKENAHSFNGSNMGLFQRTQSYDIASTVSSIVGQTLITKSTPSASISSPIMSSSTPIIGPPTSMIRFPSNSNIKPLHCVGESQPNQSLIEHSQGSVLGTTQSSGMRTLQATMFEPSQASVLGTSQSSVMKTPQETMFEPSQASMMEPSQMSLIRAPQPSLIQTTQGSMASTQQPSIIGTSQTSLIRTPPPSTVRTPQTFLMGTSYASNFGTGTPQISMPGPPSMSNVNQSLTGSSILRPPPTSMMNPPSNSYSGAAIGGTSMLPNLRPLPPSMIGQHLPPSSVMGQPAPPSSMMGQPAPPSSMMGQQPPPSSMMGRPPPPSSMMGRPPPPSSMMGQPPPPSSMMGRPPLPSPMMGRPPPPSSMMGQPPPPSPMMGRPPPPSSMIGQPPPPSSMMGQPPPPSSMMGQPPPPSSVMGQPPPPSSMMGQPHPPIIRQPPPPMRGLGTSSSSVMGQPPNSILSPPPMSMVGQSTFVGDGSKPPIGSYNNSSGNSIGNQSAGGNSSRYPNQQPQPYVNQVSQQLGGLSVTKEGWNKSWGTSCVDLMQQKVVLPLQGVVPPKPVLLQEYLPNCSPDIFRCTISKIPETQSVLQKSRLPFGILIHPFKDLEHLAVVSCNTIVRCRSCRTYINPFVVFKGDRRWECNLCFRVNDLPDEFQFDPLTRTYGDPSRRPEVREATIEFIAPQEYMLRPPQPATYIWVLDVSRQAVETGYLKIVCDTLLQCLDKIPGDRRALIGFITYSTTVQFYLMGEGQKSVQMLDVGEIDDIFIPSPEDLLVRLSDSRNLIEEFLTTLPDTHKDNVYTQTAFGAALTAAYKLVAPIGGRITAMAVTLPTIGPGALKPREDPNQRSAKNISNLGPATDFYKKLALDCSGQQIAVDLFTFNSQYIDLATLSGISKFSGGSIHHFPGFNVLRNPASVDPFRSCLTRYITRKIGFEAVMRIRTTRGLDITNFHGNFFVRSTDLLSLPNINPDSGFGMQISIEEPLHNIRQACFQAALLYTSSKGERRIRVHTLCLPVCPNVHEIIAAGDQQAIVDLLAKMAVDRCVTSQMSDAREAIINACSDILAAYKASLSTASAGLPAPPTLQVLPLYLLGLLKSIPLRHGISTKLDDRVFAMCEMKTMPLKYLIQSIYPDLYSIHYLSEKGAINLEDLVIPQPDHLQLSGEYIDRDGAYLMDVGSVIYVYIRSGISSEWVNEVLGFPSFAAIPQPLYEEPFPSLDNLTSELVRNFIYYLQRNKPYSVPVYVIREDNPSRNLFLQYLVDDRSEGAHSYVEFLQFIKPLVK